ncbi:aldehyde dehydrogenase family protein (plasmid) [Alloyangia pacifica]|uniref:Aldehyde dehydrogenase family protein n=1 Tax=Alloyangia pacifica TaxID=311180 RepID=A0A2U8HK23_9RHOB|nr:aldehyde dehydrogenase family protein [Alloyangia pacifica]AWI85900.1 aldehyde dehydrogenase family protein [Alloyangia pacifica]
MGNSAEIEAANARIHQFYIDGAWVDATGPERADVVNPATEEVIAEVALGSVEETDRAVAAARAAFPAWAATQPMERAGKIARLRELILENTQYIAGAITAEMGAAISYAQAAQVPLAAEHLRAACEVLRDYEFLTRRGQAAILREPIGVCGLITPWNWPLYQITAKAGSALAAGCTVVLKPSELSPLSAALFADLVDRAGFPAGVFNLVNGTGPVVGARLAEHPDVDMVSITGSTRAGVAVAQAAAATVKRVAQELGGKSPNVILPDADLSKAVPPGVASAMRNVGQSCSAPTRMIVPRARLAEVEALAVRALEDMRVGDPTDADTTHGPSSNRAQYARVQTMIRTGIAEGAKLLAGGPGRPEGLTRGFFSRPTIFSEVTTGMAVAQEEIFGPVLVILAYDDVEEAIAIANDTVYGLGAHVQGTDMTLVRSTAAGIRAGQVHLNYPASDPHVPFGGYKQSGNGREYGVEGLEEYLEIKSILGYFDGE